MAIVPTLATLITAQNVLAATDTRRSSFVAVGTGVALRNQNSAHTFPPIGQPRSVAMIATTSESIAIDIAPGIHDLSAFSIALSAS